MQDSKTLIPGELIVRLKVSANCYYCGNDQYFTRTVYRTLDDDLEIQDELTNCKQRHNGPPRFEGEAVKEWTYGELA